MIYKIVYKYKGSKLKEPRAAYIRADNSLDATDDFLDYQKEVCKKKVEILFTKEVKPREDMEIIKYKKGTAAKETSKVKTVQITKQELDKIFEVIPTDYSFIHMRDNIWYDEESEVYFEVVD